MTDSMGGKNKHFSAILPAGTIKHPDSSCPEGSRERPRETSLLLSGVRVWDFLNFLYLFYFLVFWICWRIFRISFDFLGFLGFFWILSFWNWFGIFVISCNSWDFLDFLRFSKGEITAQSGERDMNEIIWIFVLGSLLRISGIYLGFMVVMGFLFASLDFWNFLWILGFCLGQLLFSGFLSGFLGFLGFF